MPDALIEYIARRSHEEDRQSGYKEGGRVVRKLLADLVDSSVQREAGKRQKEYEDASRIELIFLPPAPAAQHAPAEKPHVDVKFHKKVPPSLQDFVAETAAELKLSLDRGVPPEGLIRMLQDCAARLEGMDANQTERLKLLRQTSATIEDQQRHGAEEGRAAVTELIAVLAIQQEVPR